MGMGLPLEVISWGSLLSLSDKALMTKAWWIIMIPGLFLIVVCLPINISRLKARTKRQSEE